MLTAIAGLARHRRGRRRCSRLADMRVPEHAPTSPLGPPDVELSTVLRAVAVLVGVRRARRHHACVPCRSIKPIEALRAE